MLLVLDLNMFAKTMVTKIFFCVFSKSFLKFLGFAFRVYFHSLCTWCKVWVKLHLSHVDIQLFLPYLLKRLFSPWTNAFPHTAALQVIDACTIELSPCTKVSSKAGTNASFAWFQNRSVYAQISKLFSGTVLLAFTYSPSVLPRTQTWVYWEVPGRWLRLSSIVLCPESSLLSNDFQISLGALWTERVWIFLLFSRSVVSNSFTTPWTVAHQAPLSVGFPMQEYWIGLPFPSPGDLPNPGIKLTASRLLHCIRVLYHWAAREALWILCTQLISFHQTAEYPEEVAAAFTFLAAFICHFPWSQIITSEGESTLCKGFQTSANAWLLDAWELESASNPGPVF